MKKIYSLLLILGSYYTSNSQIPISDALQLRTFINSTTGIFEPDSATIASVNNIVGNYTDGSLKVIYQTNPFLKEYCAKIAPLVQGAKTGAELLAPGTPINTGSIIIDGLARFIVERIKKELQAAFFEHLYTFIRKPEFQDVRTLFPNTCQTLLAIGDQIYNYEIYLTSLRNAFGRDIEIILPNLENVIRNGRYATFFNAHLELRSVCLTAIFVAKGLKRGDHIGTVLEEFPATDPDYIPAGSNEENVGIVRAIQFVQELSKSLKASSVVGNRYWADNATLNELKDETTLKLYLGLFYERVKEIKFGNAAGETFGELLAKAKDKLDQLKELVYATKENIKACEQSLSSLRAEQTIEGYFEYINSISNLLNGITSSNPFRQLNLSASALAISIQTKIDKVWELLAETNLIIDNAMNIYLHIKGKKYTQALANVRNIYKERFSTDKLNGNANEKKRIELILDFLFEYGTALAEMAEATNSKEVYEAIDRIAAPVGSSRIKKENVFSISLNSYGGVFIGKESIENVEDESTANNYGVSAPVGLAFSLGKIKNREKTLKGNKSLTLFISVIDIGAPVSFRFQNDTLDEIPSVSWKDIFAPGVQLIYGFGKVPISISAGWQTGPNLRKVSSQYNEYLNSKYSRLSLGIYVDIPIFILARRKYW